MLRALLFIFLGVLAPLLIGCSSHFSDMQHIRASTQTIMQNSRVAIFVGEDDKLGKDNLKVTTRLTYLNELDSLTYGNREYFFLEIFNDSPEVVLPDSLELSLFNKKPVWIREVKPQELDDLLFLENDYAKGYLIAFRRPSAFLRKDIVVDLYIANLGKASYNFSYKVIKTGL